MTGPGDTSVVSGDTSVVSGDTYVVSGFSRTYRSRR